MIPITEPYQSSEGKTEEFTVCEVDRPTTQGSMVPLVARRVSVFVSSPTSCTWESDMNQNMVIVACSDFRRIKAFLPDEVDELKETSG